MSDALVGFLFLWVFAVGVTSCIIDMHYRTITEKAAPAWTHAVSMVLLAPICWSLIASIL